VSYEVSDPVPIPADVEMPDKILAGLTARQVAIAAVAAVIIWAGWMAARRVMPLPAFAALAAPVGLAATALVIGERDGLPLDRLLAAAWRHARSPRRLVTAPEGIPAAPAWAAPPGPPPASRRGWSWCRSAPPAWGVVTRFGLRTDIRSFLDLGTERSCGLRCPGGDRAGGGCRAR
jgi:PrgI family protein